MGDDLQIARTEQRRIFVSYSSSDRARVNGLALLLEALGHEVFLDHKTIVPGRRWEAALQKGLEEADVLLVFWTRYAARSDWVRKETEYFHRRHPDRPIVPMRGDEAPLTELLMERQEADLFPLVNELLEMRNQMVRQRVDRVKIEAALLSRLREAGIEIGEGKRRKLLMMFARTGSLGLLVTPLASVLWLARTGLETYAHLSTAQVVAVAVPIVIVLVISVPRLPGRGHGDEISGRWRVEGVGCQLQLSYSGDEIAATPLARCGGVPRATYRVTRDPS
jgi:hypothetical protein